MNKLKYYFVAVLVAILCFYTFSPLAKETNAFALPEFSETSIEDWINSAPLSVEDLRGNVILVDVWSYGCWNCYRSFPWIHTLEERFGEDGFKVVGIHTPEFDREKNRDNVVAKTIEFKVTHPVMLDNDFTYWRALNNRYWPTFYIVDKQGIVRGRFIGETHVGDTRAQQVEQLITALLAE